MGPQTDIPCHRRCSMIKNLHYSTAMSAQHRLKSAPLYRQIDTSPCESKICKRDKKHYEASGYKAHFVQHLVKHAIFCLQLVRTVQMKYVTHRLFKIITIHNMYVLFDITCPPVSAPNLSCILHQPILFICSW